MGLVTLEKKRSKAQKAKKADKGTNVRKTNKKAKAGKVPLTEREQVTRNIDKKEKSDKRIEKRENTRGSRRTKAGLKTTARPSGKPVVTADNRKEVAKGSKASGVSVDGKQVRQGKVKAAEKATKTGRINKAKNVIKKVAKAVAKRAGPIGAALTAAELGSVKRKPATTRGQQKVRKAKKNK